MYSFYFFTICVRIILSKIIMSDREIGIIYTHQTIPMMYLLVLYSGVFMIRSRVINMSWKTWFDRFINVSKKKRQSTIDFTDLMSSFHPNQFSDISNWFNIIMHTRNITVPDVNKLRISRLNVFDTASPWIGYLTQLFPHLCKLLRNSRIEQVYLTHFVFRIPT